MEINIIAVVFAREKVRDIKAIFFKGSIGCFKLNSAFITDFTICLYCFVKLPVFNLICFQINR